MRIPSVLLVTSISIAVLLMLSGCVALDDTAATPATVQPADGAADVSLETLTFEGNGNTFLSHIESVVAETGRPDNHRWVEALMADGTAWQGESLRYGDMQRVLLQQAQAGYEHAVALEMAADVPLTTALAALGLPSRQPIYTAHPQIQFVRARQDGDQGWTFDVTLAYPDKGWEDYVDGWHVETADGEILGTRVLLHPHVDEQPFTRSLSRVVIPDDVSEVIVRSHNLISGYAPEITRVPITESVSRDRYEVVR